MLITSGALFGLWLIGILVFGPLHGLMYAFLFLSAIALMAGLDGRHKSLKQTDADFSHTKGVERNHAYWLNQDGRSMLT